MNRSRGDCVFCDGPVLPLETAAWPVTGWEAERGGGGANHIIGRTRADDGRVAHLVCVKRAVADQRRGIASEQETFPI